MSLYLDTNVLVALQTPDAFAKQSEAMISYRSVPLIVSDFAATEFAAVVSRKVTAGSMAREEARSSLARFDSWVVDASQRIEIIAADVAQAGSFLRRLDLPLSAPDAIHIAIAQRLGSTLVTFDRQMAAAARTLRLAVAGA